jgi:chloramphenicol 3-O-phosphotransferase
MGMVDSPQGVLVFFFGPAGAGKSTLAREWCRIWERAAQIGLDDVRSMIVSGLADPQSGSPVVAEQYETAAQACCALARTFLSAGYDVTVDDAETPHGFKEHWEPHLTGLRWKVVVIRPDLQTTLRRNDGRTKNVRTDIIRRQHADAAQWPVELTVDTTGLTVAESLRRVEQILASQ